ncbi:MAG: hypothetical protein HC927_04200 [Deltaproteobacteria bacterium]|nr:hypothetical protein [Deltaproteobacteria bacterium]
MIPQFAGYLTVIDIEDLDISDDGDGDLSVRPGADVRTGTGDAGQHHSMKGITDRYHPGSMSRASQEIENMVGDRRRGSEAHGVVIDLRHSPDPAADRASLQAHADRVNEGLRNDGHDPIPVTFIEP